MIATIPSLLSEETIALCCLLWQLPSMHYCRTVLKSHVLRLSLPIQLLLSAFSNFTQVFLHPLLIKPCTWGASILKELKLPLLNHTFQGICSAQSKWHYGHIHPSNTILYKCNSDSDSNYPFSYLGKSWPYFQESPALLLLTSPFISIMVS